MIRFRLALGALLLGTSSVALPLAATPAAAAMSVSVDSSDPSRFIQTLSSEAFRVLHTGSRPQARSTFRTLLGQYFAIDEIGDKLIAQNRAKISDAQYQAYKSALPGFLIGTYADRLYDYSDAQVKVIRAIPRGDGAAVQSQVIRPGRSPINAIWSIRKENGGYRITNLTVAGINLVLTQTADFNSYVQKNGFDKLVDFMKSRSS